MQFLNRSLSAGDWLFLLVAAIYIIFLNKWLDVMTIDKQFMIGTIVPKEETKYLWKYTYPISTAM